MSACLACARIRGVLHRHPRLLPALAWVHRLHSVFRRRRGLSCPFTDFDGMTDFQELFSFTYQDSTSHGVTPSANYTLNLTLPDTGVFVFTVGASGTPSSGKTATLSVLTNGLPSYRYGANTSWTHTETFDARLVRGHNSLTFSIEESSGSVSVTSIAIDKDGWLTSPTDPDTDRDGLGDGAELNGDTGWILNPTDPDSDDDRILDGREVGHFFTDPTNPDTDGDGTGDFEDFDKLHDVVVQVELGGLTITAGHDPARQYYATAGIEGQWARTKSSSAQSFDLDHVVSVNTADSDWVAQYNLTVRDSTGQLVDLTPSTSTKEMAGDWFLGTESWCGTTTGTTSPAASLYYCVRTVKVGKENTLLVIPGDWSTVQNGSTGLHRYVGEQKFVFVFLNVTGSSANFSAGMNALIVPRGIYYDTAFHKLLNDTWANASSSPLVGATILGNEAGNARGLNARVAQLLVSHNVTAAQAESLLAKLLTNTSGGIIATTLDVAGEFYTLGFVNDVADLVPNVAVENTGHYAAPAPPPGDAFWTGFWNAMAGAVAHAWDAARAAAVFVANVIAAAVQWALSVVAAFAEATYAAVKAVARAIVDAILAVIQFFIDLVKALFDPILSVFTSAKALLREGFLVALKEITATNPSHEAHAWRAAAVVSLTAAAIMLLFTAVSLVLLVTDLASSPVRWIAPLLVIVALGLLVAAIGVTVFGGPDSPPGDIMRAASPWWNWEEYTLAIGIFIAALLYFFTATSNTGFFLDTLALVFSFVALLLTAVGNWGEGAGNDFAEDFGLSAGAVFAWVGLSVAGASLIHSLLFPVKAFVALGLSLAAIATVFQEILKRR